jgi:hypothetical protein
VRYANSVQGYGRSAAHSEWVEKAARVGFVAKGVIYAIIGVYAVKMAFGDGGAILGGKEATQQVAIQPFGQVLLALLGFGLAAYALWRLLQAGLDIGGSDDSGAKNAAKRIGRAASGLIYGFLAFTCFQTLVNAGSSGGGKMSYLHQLLMADGGQWVAIALGVAVIGAGVYQLYKAKTLEFQKKFETRRMSRTELTWTTRLGRFGLAARGVVLGIIGYFLVQAGLTASASQAKGTGGALREIASASYGSILLGLVAIGFIAYAVYMFASARYRDVYA